MAASQSNGRRYVVLGSSPVPHPAPLDGADLICVNSSGFVARDLGLPEPELTVLAGFKLIYPNRQEDRDALRGLKTKCLLLITYLLPISLEEAEELLEKLGYRYDELKTIDFADRAHVIRSVTGTGLGEADAPENRISNGVFAACYALYHGASEVILSGISLTLDGHFYMTRTRPRRHITTDTEALIAMRTRGWPVKTSEADVSQATGIPLV